MTITQIPLEKQLVNIDLGKGVDETVRPELMAGITTLDNLVCDQQGSWVKRPGTNIGPVSDASGTGGQPIFPRKVLSLVNGWGCIGDYGTLYQYQELQGTLRASQKHMDFSVNHAEFVSSTGPTAQSSTTGTGVLSVASSTYHDAFICAGLDHASPLTITERSTGTTYVYRLSLVPGMSNVSPYVSDVKMCFVGDRYLHVFVAQATVDVWVIVIDTLAAMPATEAAIAAPVHVVSYGGTAPVLLGCVGGAAYSYLMSHPVSGWTATEVYAQVGSSGANSDSVSLSAVKYEVMDLDETAHTLWLMIPGDAGGTTLRGLDSTNLSVDIVATYTQATPGSVLSCNTTTGGLKILYYTTATFGGTTIPTIEVVDIASAGATPTIIGAMYGWSPVSYPFFSTITGKHYVHLVKSDTTSELSSHIICDISTFTQYTSNTAALAVPYGSFRNAGNLEPFNGLQKVSGPYRYTSPNGYEFSACVSYQVAQRVAAIGFMRLRVMDSTAYGAANFDGSTHVAHGGLNSFDGRQFVDMGFADQPTLTFVTPTTTVGNLDGSYRYVAVYRHVDANGSSTYSRTYGPIATVNVAGSTGKNTITVQPHSVTNRDSGKGDSAPFVELYRTKSGGTQYYLCASSQRSMSSSPSSSVQQLTANATSGLLSVLDNLSDTTLGSQAIMYRQPGTTNAPADRYTGPACKMVVQHKDRLFCVDPYGQRVYYSSFFVDGEAPWFNPAFNFYVHAGTGPITGLASMDGRLFIFKKDAIFVVDGDGPGESGPTGNEYSPPQGLSSSFGCLDHRGIVNTTSGIVYRSIRGIEMLDRSLKVTWLGQRVMNTVQDYPITTGACLGAEDRIHFTLAATEGYAGAYAVAGIEAIYDISADVWSFSRGTGYDGVYSHARQGVASVVIAGVNKLVYVDGFIGLWVEDPTIGGDYGSGYYVPFKIETGWIKQGPQARQRVSDILFLAKKVSGANHAIKISLAYDYSSSYTQTKTWEPGTINAASIEELLIQPIKQQVLAIRVKIEDQAPALINITSSTDASPIVLTVPVGHGFITADTVTIADHVTNVAANGSHVIASVTATTITLDVNGSGDGAGSGGTITFPVGNGRGCEVLAITAEVAPKQGSPKLAAVQTA